MKLLLLDIFFYFTGVIILVFKVTESIRFNPVK